MFYVFLFCIAAICLFLAGRDREFWHDLTKNTQHLKSYRAKWHVLVSNAKYMFYRWFETLKWVKIYRRDHPYFVLVRAGFRITEYRNGYTNTTMYRFFWNGEMLPQHGDITDLGEGMWASTLDGFPIRLDLPFDENRPKTSFVSDWQSLDDDDIREIESRLK